MNGAKENGGAATVSASGSLAAVRLIAEEISKDDTALASKFEQILPHVALRVDANMTGLVSAAAKIANKCKRSKRICTRDVERAIRMEFSESNAPIFFVTEQARALPTGDQQQRLFCFQEPEVNLKEYTNEDFVPLPKAPIAPTFAIHWLAVEGVQPTIPENDVSGVIEETDPTAQSKKRTAAALGATQHEDDSATLTRELSLYLDKITTNLVKAEAGLGGDASVQDKARHSLACLSNDAGIDRLIPHFVRFVVNHVSMHLKQLPALWTGVKIAEALVLNENLHSVDLYLHELLPALLTCIVGKALCESPGENHWSLREAAAKVVALICQKYGDLNAELQPRVVEIFREALFGADRPLTTQYGGIVGLTALGPMVVNNVLVPLLRREKYLETLEAAARRGIDENLSDAEFERTFEAFKVLNVLREALSRGPGPVVVDRWEVLNALGYEWSLFSQEAAMFI